MILPILNAFLISIFFAFCCNAQKADRQPALIDNERLLVERIKQVAGWDNRGFVTRVNEVPGDFLPRLEKDSNPERLAEEEQATYWKVVIRRYAEAYEKAQKQANDRNQPGPAKFRKQIQDLFAKRLEMRGGGSVSWEMWMYLPGYVEWILGHMDSGGDRSPSDQQLMKETLASYPLDLNPDAENKERVARVIADLKKIESKLAAPQAHYLRNEFVRFFKKETPSNP